MFLWAANIASRKDIAWVKSFLVFVLKLMDYHNDKRKESFLEQEMVLVEGGLSFLIKFIIYCWMKNRENLFEPKFLFKRYNIIV